MHFCKMWFRLLQFNDMKHNCHSQFKHVDLQSHCVCYMQWHGCCCLTSSHHCLMIVSPVWQQTKASCCLLLLRHCLLRFLVSLGAMMKMTRQDVLPPSWTIRRGRLWHQFWENLVMPMFSEHTGWTGHCFGSFAAFSGMTWRTTLFGECEQWNCRNEIVTLDCISLFHVCFQTPACAPASPWHLCSFLDSNVSMTGASTTAN